MNWGVTPSGGDIEQFTSAGCSFQNNLVITKMLKLQAIFHGGSVGLEFMTDDPSEAEEMREQMLAFECIAEVVVLDESGWVSL
jgi:hypothetical protein